MKKRWWLGWLASFLGGGGAALGQGYYPVYGPPPGPAPMMVPYNGVLQNMPGGYGTPYQPGMGRATVSDAPRVHGWPPPPGSIPMPPVPGGQFQFVPTPVVTTPTAAGAGRTDPNRVTTAGGAPGAGSISQVSKTATPTPAPASAGPAEPVMVLPDYTPVSKFKSHHKNSAECTTCQPGHVMPLVDPCPGTPLMCEECCPPQQPLVHPIPERAPRGYCGYARAEAMYWMVNPQESVPLFNFASIRGTWTVRADDLDNGERVGGRGTMGFWINPQQTVGLETTLTLLANRSPGFVTNGPTIVRPYVDRTTGALQQITVAAPGVATGGISAQSSMEFYQGEANARFEVCRFKCGHIDFLGGFRYLHLDEDLAVSSVTAPAGGPGLATYDRFSTTNNFYGGQLGVEGELNWGRLFVNPWAKCAVGYDSQLVTIVGNRVGAAPGGPVQSLPGGLLALPTNIGTYRQGEFCFVPEVGFNVGVCVTSNIRLTAGYTLLYLSNVVRPGDQIDPRLNLSQLQQPGGPPPAPAGNLGPFYNTFNDTSLWAHGASLGLEIRW